jgi:hypothetical protein
MSNKKFIIYSAIAILLVIFAVTQGFGLLKGKLGTTQPAPVKTAMTLIITELANQGQKAEFVKYELKDGLYAVTWKVGTQESISYVNSTGTMLFPYSIPLVTTTTTTKPLAKSDKPVVELFVMAFCPFGNQAEDGMYPAYNLLKDYADIKLRYIVEYTDSTKTAFKSLHLDQELHEDIRELCVAKYNPDKLWPFVEAINKDCTAQNADTCWTAEANKVGLDTAQIQQCQKDEGNNLLTTEYTASQKYGVQGSPTLVINGITVSSDRTPEGYKNTICSAFNDSVKPAACSQTLAGSSASTTAGSCN